MTKFEIESSHICRDIEERKADFMLTTVEAIVRAGKIELLEHVEVPEGTRALVTLLENAEGYTEDYTSEEEDAEDIRDARLALEDACINGGTKSLDEVKRELGL